MNRKYLLMMSCLFVLQLVSNRLSAQEGLLGKTNIYALIEEVPTIPETPVTAVARTFGANILNAEDGRLTALYRPVRDKVTRQRDALAIFYQQKQKNTYGGKEGLEDKVKKEINQNALIAEMGGIDAISKMSPEESQRLAEKAAKKMMQQYAAPDGIPIATTSEMKNKDVTIAALQITEKLTALKNRLSSIQGGLDSNIKSLQTTPGNFMEIEQEYHKLFGEIPIVTLGELRDKDPSQVKALIKKNTEKCRVRNSAELKQIVGWYSDARSKMKIEIDAYYQLLVSYKKLEPQLKVTYNQVNIETSLAQFESDLMTLASYMADISEKVTYATAVKEREHYLRTQS